LPKASNQPKNLIVRTLHGWREFWKHPSALVMLAYAFLWLSALSPHGVLLTSFLKGGWNISEFYLGLFRGLGALFGLLATLIYPRLEAQLGVALSGLTFIGLQALTLIIAVPFFASKSFGGLVFLSLILVSRIGLYGFSLAEMEIRQRTIALGQRGQINGVASSLTSFATLILFGMGTLVGSHEDFKFLFLLSIIAVSTGACTFLYWFKKHSRSPV
jgi:iron-regulated transporter 1